jgi:hypothetical protein
MPHAGTTWLRALQLAPSARAIVVCFPPGGGSAGAYRALAQQIPQGITVYAVQYPGRQDRMHDPLVADIGELAGHITTELLSWGAVPNLALFGTAWGQQLRSRPPDDCSARIATQAGCSRPAGSRQMHPTRGVCTRDRTRT